jgi:cell division protein FtsW
MKSFLQNIKGDKVIWAVVILLSVFSVLAVYSSTTTLAYREQKGNTEYYLMKHLGIMAFGLVLMYLTHKIKYTYYARISVIAMLVSIPLLLYTAFLGPEINDASRWTTLPVINVKFQSSDLAKLALIMFIAYMLAKKQDKIKDFKTAFLPIVAPIIIICVIILKDNLSTAALLFATCTVLLFIGRVNMKYIFAMIGIGASVLLLFILILMLSPKSSGRLGTWQNRIEHFRSGSADENYQVEQAKIAIANGKVLGKMPGNSIQKNFLPNPFNDFIYAVIIEEYGLIGGVIIPLLYLILMFRGIRIVIKAPGNYGAFLAIGVTCSLVFQAFMNMAVAVNLVPVTGQPLPLVSMGGTSIWFTSIAIGIILSVSKELESNDNNEVSDAKA